MHRHGKFLDVETADGPHLVTHLARAGWLHWKDSLPGGLPPPRQGPARPARRPGDRRRLRFRRRRARRRLAVYVVADPRQVPGVARLGPDPLADDFDEARFARSPRRRAAAAQGRPARPEPDRGVGNAYSDEILHAARMSPFKLAASLTDEETARLAAALRGTLTEAVGGNAPGASPPAGSRPRRRAGCGVHGRTGEPCPSVRRHRSRGLLQRLLAPVLPDLPDRRQAAGGPEAVPAAQVAPPGSARKAMVPHS